MANPIDWVNPDDNSDEERVIEEGRSSRPISLIL